MTEPKPGWSEADSHSFVDIGDVAVPSRAEQLSMLLSLIPADADEEFLTADICCGEGMESGVASAFCPSLPFTP